MTPYNRELCMSEEWCVGAYKQTDPEADVCTCARVRTHTHTHTSAFLLQTSIAMLVKTKA